MSTEDDEDMILPNINESIESVPQGQDQYFAEPLLQNNAKKGAAKSDDNATDSDEEKFDQIDEAFM